MRWKLKAHAAALLSRMPGGIQAFGRLQRCLGTNRLDTAESVERALEIIELVREAGGDPRGGTYLEIGTGCRPFLPFLLHLAGAGRVITFDIRPWLTRAYARETAGALAAQLPTIARRLGADVRPMQARYDAAMANASTLSGLLRGFGVQYRCPADAGRTGLAGASVDCVCSSNVLEHIPPQVLAQMHRESLRVLKPGGLAVHRFNPQDHYAGVDASITGVNFLQYSERAWRWYGGSGLAYHNRLRCGQHRALFGAAGLRVRIDRVRIDRRAVEAIRRGDVAVHADFAGYTPEELAADYMWVVAERPCGPVDRPPGPAGGDATALCTSGSGRSP